MIKSGYFLVNVALLSAGTFLIRASFIALAGRFAVPPRVKELFGYIPAAVFPALVVPSVFFHQGTVAWIGGKERLLILVMGGIVGYFVRSTLLVIAGGLGLLYLATHL